MTRNPFLNYCNERHQKGRNAIEVVKEASKSWKLLSKDQKAVYIRRAGNEPYRYHSKNRHFNQVMRYLDLNNQSNTTDLRKLRRAIDKWMLESVSKCLNGNPIHLRRKPPDHYT